MKKLLAKIALVATLVAPLAVPLSTQAASTWDTTGSYVIAFNYLGSDYSHNLALTQNVSDQLAGNGSSGAYTWVITSGSVSGNAVDFLANYTATADAVVPQTTMHVVGTIAGDGTMSGTWSDNYGGGSRAGTWMTTSGTVQPKMTSATVVVSGNTSAGENLPGWMFNRDLSTMSPYVFNTDEQSIGVGSLYVLPIGANASDKFIAENFINAPLSDVHSISYDFQISSTSLATQEEQFYMNVYANYGVSADDKFYDCKYDVVPTVGSTGAFTTVTFDPTQAYPVTTRGGANASQFVCPAIPADMNLQSAGSNIRAFSINVGDTSTSDIGVNGYLDKVVTSVGSTVTTYDFEPVAAPLLGTLNAEDFGVVNYDTGLGILKGYTAGFGVADNTFAGATSVVVQLYAAGDVLLQTNTAILPKFNADITGTQFSSPFDVSGTFDYVTDGYWTNVREAEFGQSVPATKVVATVTLANGKVVTATNTNLTGDPTTIYPPVVMMHTLTTATAGTGSGTITSTPAGINCGVDCSESYAHDTVVTLTATPATGSTFTEWSGACSGMTCVVTMSGAMSATATFTLDVVVPPTTPTDKNQCKSGGYKNFIDPSTGKAFKNQGLCVSFTNQN